MDIHIVPQSVCGDNDDSQHNTTDIDGGSNVHRVIQAFNFYMTSSESQKKCKSLQDTFVPKQD